MQTVRKFSSLRDETPQHVYRWDEIPEHHDPVKTAEAINILHLAGHLSDTDIQKGRFNRRVEDHYDNLQRQQERRVQIGIVGANEPMSEPSEFGNDNET